MRSRARRNRQLLSSLHPTRANEKARPASGGSGCSGMRRMFSRGKRTLRPPVWLSGRRSVLWCALSRLISPLAFAGIAAGAKPNHRFFVCQQLGRFFFAPIDRRTSARSAWRASRHACTASRRRFAHSRRRKKTASFQVFFRARRMRRNANASVRTPPFRSRTNAEPTGARCMRDAKKTGGLARRTSRFARICANDDRASGACERPAAVVAMRGRRPERRRPRSSAAFP